MARAAFSLSPALAAGLGRFMSSLFQINFYIFTPAKKYSCPAAGQRWRINVRKRRSK
jgi:hypothetical protein